MIPRYSREPIASIWKDETKFSIWLRIELLACEAQSKLGLIPESSLKTIQEKAQFEVKRILEIEEIVKHDVIAFLTNVAEYVGPDSRFIHMGMTSSDILDTTLSYQMKEAGNLILENLETFKRTLARKAKQYKTLLMIGRTHNVHAEPITLGLKFALWFDEIKRNIDRMKLAIKAISVGKISGAVGTYEHISPFVEKYVCKKLGLRPASISTQIIQRDIHSQYMSTLALIASGIEKIATEIRHLQRTEVLELEESFSKWQKGSSAMPHKKNPITAEQLCGLARVVRANSFAALENIPLWHERDISHSSVERIIIPDSTILVDYMLFKINQLIENIVVYKENIQKNLNLTNGLIFSQSALLKLIEKKMTREDAYKIIQQLAMQSWNEKIPFEELLRNNNIISHYLDNKDFKDIFNYKNALKNVNLIFKRLGLN
ncbi:MAG: adenylosuccinate lyase [Ignavibacteria bacterium]